MYRFEKKSMHSFKSQLFDYLNLLSKLTFNRLLNYTLNIFSFAISVLFKSPVVFSKPISLSVEPTSYCNLQCPHCPTGNKKILRKQGAMDFADFDNILCQTSSHLIYLILYFQGEPFMHKHIFQMIALAKKKRIYTMTSTNAHFIDDVMAKKIVQSGLDKIIISLDGLTQEVYEKYRWGGEVSKVIGAIELILKYKDELKSNTPFVELQFLVLKHNELEMHKVAAFARLNKNVSLQFKTAQIYDIQNNENYIPLNHKYSRYRKLSTGEYILKKKLKNRCYRMWSSAVITWDGKLVPCCFDKDAQHIFGNIKDQSLANIWRSHAYNAFRKQILNNRKSIDMCANCGE